jgi:peptidoglycan/LPS O-acetylase OafA/YrhL
VDSAFNPEDGKTALDTDNKPQSGSHLSLEERKTQLDGLRCVAVTMVVVAHMFPVFTYEQFSGVGVQIFFVISGLLISRILLKSHTGSLKHDAQVFYTRRILRIFPLYYLVITVALFAHIMPSHLMPFFFSYTFNIAHFFGQHISDAGPLDPLWSLCVEEQFYLLAPLLIWLTPRKFLPKVIFALIIASTVCGVFLDRVSPPYPGPHVLLIYSGQFLLWGCLTGCLDVSGWNRIKGTTMFIAGLALLAAWYALHLSGCGNLQFLKGLALTGIVFGLWKTENRYLLGTFRWKPVAYLGLISYGIYIYHDLVILITVGLITKFPFLMIFNASIVCIVLTFVVSSMSWYMFERPFNKFKRFFPYCDQPQRVAQSESG